MPDKRSWLSYLTIPSRFAGFLRHVVLLCMLVMATVLYLTSPSPRTPGRSSVPTEAMDELPATPVLPTAIAAQLTTPSSSPSVSSLIVRPPPPSAPFRAHFESIPSVCRGHVRERVDIVYTWVDGNDPEFIKQVEYFRNPSGKAKPSSITSNITSTSSIPSISLSAKRFRDFDELRYSIRSLLKFFKPHINHIYIITNGQVPSFLNFTRLRPTAGGHRIAIKVVTHEELYPPEDRPYLPTFSSPAIETVIHRIPGLTTQFLYLNNDLLLNRPTSLSEFYRGRAVKNDNGDAECEVTYTFHLTGRVVDWPCRFCPAARIRGPQCTVNCFFQSCEFDGRHCRDALKVRNTAIEQFKPYNLALNASLADYANQLNQLQSKYVRRFDFRPIPTRPLTLWRQTILFVNALFNLELGEAQAIRRVLGHIPLLVDVRIMEALHRRFAVEFLATRRSRFRRPVDMQTQFAYVYYAMQTINTGDDKGLINGFKKAFKDGFGESRANDQSPVRFAVRPMSLTNWRTRSANSTAVREINFGFGSWRRHLSNLHVDRSHKRYQFVALQDAFADEPTEEDALFIHQQLELLLPVKSAFEIKQTQTNRSTG